MESRYEMLYPFITMITPVRTESSGYKMHLLSLHAFIDI